MGQLEGVNASYTAPLWSITQPGGEYELISASSNAFQVVGTGYIDVAGLSMEQKTIAIEKLSVQYQFPPEFSNAVTGDGCSISVIVADVPIAQIDHIGPGFSGSTMSADNCFIHRYQQWSVGIDAGGFSSFSRIENETITGMASKTTSDRIYYSAYLAIQSKILGVPPISTLDNVIFPGIRIVLGCDVYEEADYVYLMRQRRAYELQQEPDVD